MKLKKYAIGILHSYKTTQRLRHMPVIKLHEIWFDAYNLPLMKKIFATGIFSIDEQEPCGCTALMAATARGNITIVQWLMSKGANIHHKSSDNGSSLEIAYDRGHENILQYLNTINKIA